MWSAMIFKKEIRPLTVKLRLSRGGSKIPCRRVRWPSGGRQHIILSNFPKNCMKSRKFLLRVEPQIILLVKMMNICFQIRILSAALPMKIFLNQKVGRLMTLRKMLNFRTQKWGLNKATLRLNKKRKITGSVEFFLKMEQNYRWIQ